MKSKVLNQVEFRIGPWPSTEHRDWQAAYDAIVDEHEGAARPLHGLLRSDLSPLPLEDQLVTGRRGRRDEAESWIRSWVTSASAVVERFGGRISAFEAVPRPNLAERGSGLARVHPTWFAKLLTDLSVLDAETHDVRVRLIAGALVGGQCGRRRAAAYATAVFRAGREQFGWPRGGQGPVAGWAMHPCVSGGVGDGKTDGWVELTRFATSMRRRSGPKARVFVSGLVGHSRHEGARSRDGVDGASLHQLVASDDRFIVVLPSAWEGPAPPASAARSGDVSSVETDVSAWAVERLPAKAQRRDTPPEVPVADGFDPPVGDRAKQGWAEYRRDTELADEYYHAHVIRGCWHPGEDWNRGWGDTDKGDPIYAIAHGLVTAAREGKGSWGNIVLVEHQLPDGRRLWSQYAHLLEMLVGEGQLVARGQPVGTLGRGNPPPGKEWSTHLHFEIRNTDLDFDNWSPMVRNKTQVLANYAAPRPFIDDHRPGALVEPGGSPVVVDDADAGFSKADVPYWFESDIGHNQGATYTYASAADEANVATWSVMLPALGHYLVSAFVPRRYATTRNATYTVAHRDGDAVARVNQNNAFDAWVNLGVFVFDRAASVRLTDVTGEAASAKRKVCFDAIRWLPVK